jgi:XTP/dITP diphosphohydrolase
MKTISFATTNSGKFRSMYEQLHHYKINVIRQNIELPESRTYDITKIATEKILFAYDHLKAPCIVVDSGFYIESLNGFPRTFVKFALETIGIHGILKLTENETRKCEFKNCLAYMDDHLTTPIIFDSIVSGLLSKEPTGNLQNHCQSDLYLIFIPENETKTWAEMDTRYYDRWKKTIRDSYKVKFSKWFIENRF